MIDPVSMAAVGTLAATVGTSMANETGRRFVERLGSLAARVTGRQVPAPTDRGGWDALGRTLADAARSDPEHARRIAAVLDLAGGAAPAAGRRPPPLPPGVRSFTDRRDPLRLLTREASRKDAGRPRRALVYGPEGIGTSALAVQWAHGHQDAFPDGAVLADLRGEAPGRGRDAAVVLRELLTGLGVPPAELPPSPEERGARFREITEGRRMIVILDHAQSAAQVAPLLTGAPGVFTLVTARRLLAGLDAAPVPLGPLPKGDALALLTAVAGRRTVRAAGRRLPVLLDRCGGSPYALHAVARSLLATDADAGTETETETETETDTDTDTETDTGTSTDVDRAPHPEPGPDSGVDPHADPAPTPDSGPGPCTGSPESGTDRQPTPATGVSPEGAAMPRDPVRTIVEDVYAQLETDTARCYRLWALRPWSPLTPALAARIGGGSEQDAARRLAELAAHGLLDGLGPGPGPGTASGDGYRYRDAARRHAEALALREDGLAACARAVQRGVEHLADFAVAADRAAHPQRWHLSARHETVAPLDAGEGTALTALVAALPNLVEAARAADEFEDTDTVLALAEASWPAQLKAGRHDEVLPLLRLAARTVRARRPGTAVAGRVLVQLGHALMDLGDHAAAEDALREAAEADRAAGHLRGRATAVESLGLLRLRQWRWQEAVDCFAQAGDLWDGVGRGDPGFGDQPGARALLQRHRGRALRGLGDFTASLACSHTALAAFQAFGAAYNTARTLTDLAETHLEAGAPQDALLLIDEALTLLPAEAEPHVRYLRTLRAQCTAGRDRPGDEPPDGPAPGV